MGSNPRFGWYALAPVLTLLHVVVILRVPMRLDLSEFPMFVAQQYQGIMHV